LDVELLDTTSSAIVTLGTVIYITKAVTTPITPDRTKGALQPYCSKEGKAADPSIRPIFPAYIVQRMYSWGIGKKLKI
jgi:hypothetical protein